MVIIVLWGLGLLFIFVSQHSAIKKADRDWHINAATFKRLRRKINNGTTR